MDVRDAVASRYSCRAFLPTPIPIETIKGILNGAARAPSGGNLQPWLVHVLAGARLEALKDQLRPRFAKELPRGEGAEYQVYPPNLKEPYYTRRFRVGEQLYASIGIPRDDRPGRYRQFGRNYLFYDAPVGIFVSVDRIMGAPQWSDLGAFIQNVSLLARAHGLHTCAQEAWTSWHKTVSAFLKLPPEHILFCGIALGHADDAAPINRWRSEREPVEAFARFEGF
ncbi:MAG TPA: nitroreductase [Xanthobacteraceae bacterium]|jgi:nitroreductase|nr:nitroreductase [Xanthobacteraceae bacterium]